MPRIKGLEEKLQRMSDAWRTLTPEKSFGGMTLTQFEAACAPSIETRAEIAELQDKTTQAMARRDAADDVTAAKMQLVVNGVRADPSEGEDGPLYAAFGYTRKSERKTGLTRKSREPAGA